MDKRKQRTQTKFETIKQVALELFAAQGVDKVSVDEIAAKANVSKVTLYKYFGSKEDLYAQVVEMVSEQILADTENILNSDMDFIDKLKTILLSPVNVTEIASWKYLQQMWEKDNRLSSNETLQQKVRALMEKFVEDGKRQGYIDENLSFEMIYLYAEIFRAGLKAKAIDLEAVLVDKQAVEQLVNMHYFGILKRQ